MSVEVGLLGVVEARIDGAPVSLGGARQRRLLGCLALAPGQVRTVDGLAAALWPDGDLPVDPRHAVRTYASRLRVALGQEVVVGRDGGYLLVVPQSAIDAGRFEMLVREAADPGCARERAITLLTEALDLWRGDAFESFETEEWARADAVRLEELRARAIDDRAEALLATGRPADAVADLEAAVLVSPLRERSHALLMTALHRSGRQAEALRAYQRYRRQLATDLGLEPGAELKRLEEEIAADAERGPSLDFGRAVRGYELGERIGDGSFSVVYRGVQPSVGRDVAIKVIRAELANRPEFIRHFEVEAHLVARLEHPRIVPLYDYWREPGSAYLVMRLLRGGTLDQRIGSHRLEAHEAVRLAIHLGEALSAAHHAGIVHRDVKPANVFLDGDGNFFLGDFGIALAAAAPVDSIDSLSLGSPAYASPEQLRRQPVGPPADVHGMAITLYEALTGQLPYPGARSQAELLRRQLSESLPPVTAIRPDLSGGVDRVLARAAAKDPSDRYTSVEEFVDAFVGAVNGAPPAVRLGAATLVGERRNPYKGLRSFQEGDAADFHGRQRLVDRLVTKLSGPTPVCRFLTVVGPSGSGKSSVVRAGLLPSLRSGALPGSAQWFLTSMTPGTHPFEELEAALNRIAVAPTAGLAELMASDRRGIARAARQACPTEHGEVVVVIDQFEELFTLCADDVARQRFITGLVDAVSDPRSRLWIIATLRADFYDRPLRHPELARLVEEGAITVSPLAADELDRAITEPAARVGGSFEPGLVAQMVADVVDQPGALPLLQYTLTELFDRSVSGLMTFADYEDLGGLAGALARRAEQVYDAATPAQREAARRVLTRLVTLGEGTEDTRRRVRRVECVGVPADEDANTVIDEYGAVRLLAFDRDPATREPTVEVAHEALIREWPRLRAWLDDDRDGLRIHRHLTESSAAWVARDHDAGELYRGGRLEVAEGWTSAHHGDLNSTEAAFMAASSEQHAEQQRVDRRSRRRIKWALVAVATVAVFAVLASLIALQQQRSAVDAKDSANASADEAEAQRALAAAAAADADTQREAATSERDQARVGRLVAEAHAQTETHLDLSMLLAVEAWRRDRSPASRGAMLAGLTHQISADLPTTVPGGTEVQPVRRSASRLLGFIPVTYEFTQDIDISDDGSVIALSGCGPLLDDCVLAVFDTATRLRTGEVPIGPYFDFDLSPDGASAVTITKGGAQPDQVSIVDLDAGAIRLLPTVVAKGDVSITSVFTPDSTRVVLRDGLGALSMWDAASLEPLPTPLPPSSNISGIGFAESGWLVIASIDGATATAHLIAWDIDAGRTMRDVVVEPGPEDVNPETFFVASDLSTVLGAAFFGPVIAWDGNTGAYLGRTNAPSTRWMVQDPTNPSLVMMGGGSGQIVLYDMRNDTMVGAPLRQRGAGVRAMAAAPGADVVVSVADDRVITIWGDSYGPGLIDRPLAPDLRAVMFGGDIFAGISVSDSRHAEIRRADAPTTPGVPISTPEATGDWDFATTRPSADGSAVVAHVVRDEEWWAFVVDPVTGDVEWSYTDPAWKLSVPSVSADGRYVALWGYDRQGDDELQPLMPRATEAVRVFDMIDGTELFRVRPEESVGATPVFSPDGKYLDVMLTNGGPRRYEIADPTKFVDVVEPIFSQGTLAPIFGTTDVAGFAGLGRGLGKWDMSNGQLTATALSLDGSNMADVIASFDGSLIAAYHFYSGNIALFDTATMQALGLLPTPSRYFGQFGFTPDGDLVADGFNEASTIWDLDPDHWQVAACHAAGRNLTKAEWDEYIGADEPYRATCEEWPPGQ